MSQTADEFLVTRPWRIGRKVGRTIYAVLGPDANDQDVLIGVMDSRDLAAEVVEAHNFRLTSPMSVRSEVVGLLDSVTALGGRNFADQAPENEPRPHTVVLDHIGQAAQMKGDARVLARRRLLQVDLWVDMATDDGTTARTVENVLDGAQMTAGLRLSVSDSRRVGEPDFGLSHYIFDCEVTTLR